QARVQVSPMIMKVACFLSQHSPIFGQPASSHTVCRPLSRIIFCVAKKPGDTGALTRIQSGFFKTAESGLCAFSGWRGRTFFTIKKTTAIAPTYGGSPLLARLSGTSDCPPDQQQ